MGIPLHLAVHVVGLTVSGGLVALAVVQRERATPSWPALLVGGALLALGHVANGLLLAGDVAWPVYARAAGYAALAIGAAGRLRAEPADAGDGAGVFAPLAVAVAVAPPAAHLASALAGVAAAFAAWRGVLGHGREVLLLVGGLLAWAGADGLLRDAPTTAGVLSLLGSGLAGAWLARRTSGALVTRLLATLVAVLVVLVLGIAAASGVFVAGDLREAELERLAGVASAQSETLAVDVPREVRRAVEPYGTSARLAAEVAGFAAGTGADVDARARSLLALSSAADVALLLTVDGVVAGSWDALAVPPGPLAAEDVRIAGSGVVQAALQGQVGSDVVTLGAEGLFAVAATPLVPEDASGAPQRDAVTGVVALARRLDDDRLVADVAAATGAEVAVVVGTNVAASTLGEDTDSDVVALVTDPDATRVGEVRGTDVFVASAPVTDTGGERVATLALLQDAGAFGAVEDETTRSLFAVSLVALAIAAGAATVLARRTAGPVQELTVAAERIAAGDLDQRVDVARGDEVGRLAQAFNTMSTSLAEREESLRAAARTEASLRGRLQSVTSSMGEALVAVDARGVVLLANPAAHDLLGRPRLEGRPVTEVLRGTDMDGEDLLSRLVTGEPTSNVRGLVEARDGATTPVTASSAPLQVGERAIGRVLLLADATGEAEVERMKTQFLANISHELRTPLVPVKGYASILHSRELDRGRQVEFTGTILDSVARLERIIAMLVDYAALEAGRLEVNLTEADLVQWLRTDLPGLMPDAGKEGARRLKRRVAPGLPRVHVDRDLLSRVAVELLDNAVKFSEGPVVVSARRAGDMVELVVSDDGIGIAPEVLAGISRDFQQGDGSATRRHGGLGLGLTIATRVVERFGGELELRSEPGEGTDAVVRLPVVQP